MKCLDAHSQRRTTAVTLAQALLDAGTKAVMETAALEQAGLLSRPQCTAQYTAARDMFDRTVRCARCLVGGGSEDTVRQGCESSYLDKAAKALILKQLLYSNPLQGIFA
jgi:hypothetical protein